MAVPTLGSGYAPNFPGANSATRELLDTIEALSFPYMEHAMGMIHKGNIILDLMAYKRTKMIEGSYANGEPVQPTGLSPFETVNDIEVMVEMDFGNILAKGEAESSIFVKDGDQIQYKYKDMQATYMKHQKCDIGAALMFKNTDLQLIKSGRLPIKDYLKKKIKKWEDEVAYGLAYNIWSGTGPGTAGVDTPQFAGISSKFFDLSYDYGGLSRTTFPFLKPNVFDMDAAAAGAAVLGFTDATKLDSYSELIANDSVSTNTPRIIKLLKNMILHPRVKYGNKKPDLIIVSPNMYNLIYDAYYNWGSAKILQAQNSFSQDLVALGYEEHFKVEGVPVVADYTSWKDEQDNEFFAHPGDRYIFALYLDDWNFKINSDGIVRSAMDKLPGQHGVWGQTINFSPMFYCTETQRQTLIKLPAALDMTA